MPKLDRTGPEGKGSGTGRKLGECNLMPNDEKLEKLGRGLGKSYKSPEGKGKGKRLKSGLPDADLE